ncbi:hypothetical protein QTI66_33355 [Variovorax sp. J22R133]|nr:hypothetical protein [Variovorax sp. J22R133]MDM0117013.1 hypothetical protein [Variovorax sp. J22R133]
MDLLSSLFQAFSTVTLDDVIVWVGIVIAVGIAVIALVNAMDLFFDTEAG